ncbi:MAG TPA: thioredoxin family protein [Novosphingobium sp.]|nr:thioredoxin family protein [Novosphingobium sp.]HZV08234.1 thioredoxin family protein [Novosphingobium sp.]
MRAPALFLALAALALPQTASAAAAPHLAEQGFGDLARPLPLPYDGAADAHAAIAAARARAAAGGKLLLIDLGGNWCPDCRILAGTLALPDLALFVRAHFEVVTVDVGYFTKNLDIAESYGLGRRPAGVPAVLIVEPKSNRLVNKGHEVALADARTMRPQAIADWLAGWVR